MTVTEVERIAVLENKVDNITEKVENTDKLVKDVHDWMTTKKTEEAQRSRWLSNSKTTVLFGLTIYPAIAAAMVWLLAHI